MSKNRIRPDSGRARLEDLKKGPRGFFLCRYCGKEVDPPKITFCSNVCVHEWRLRTDPTYLRKNVFLRDKGICARCGLDCAKLKKELRALDKVARKARREALGIPKNRTSFWDADHIVPVYKSGGLCGTSGFQSLCLWCHKLKTEEDRHK